MLVTSRLPINLCMQQYRTTNRLVEQVVTTVLPIEGAIVVILLVLLRTQGSVRTLIGV